MTESLPRIALWQRAGIALLAILSALTLIASWLMIGRVGHAVAFRPEGVAAALVLTALVLVLAGTATVMAARARAARSTELLAWFMVLLAWTLAAHLFKTGPVQERVLEWWAEYRNALHRGTSEPIFEAVRELGRWLIGIDLLAHVASMLAPALFLLFSERFPRPLETPQRARSILRQLAPSLWTRLSGREPATFEALAIYSLATVGMALVFARASALDLQFEVNAMMFATSAMTAYAFAVWCVRRVERGTKRWRIEQALTAEPSDRAVLPLSSIVLLLALALAFDVLARDWHYGEGARPPGEDGFEYLVECCLFAPALLLRIRAIRAASPIVFWAGLAVLAFGSAPGLLTWFEFGTPVIDRGSAATAWWTLICSFAALGNLMVGYAHADAADRARIRWVLLGIFLSCTAMIALIATTLWCVLASTQCTNAGRVLLWGVYAPPTMLIVCMTIATFYRGAIDSALALRTSVTYVLVGLVIMVIFTTLEMTLDRVLSTVAAPDMSKWVAGSISFFVINPTKHACERGLKRLAEFAVRIVRP